METVFRLKSAETLPLDIALAERFRDMKPSPTERELLPRRVKHLEEKIRAGLGVTFHWAQAELGGELLRMNGQHSSTMLCGLNGAFPDGLFVHLDTYEVDDDDKLALLFRQFDDPKSSRPPKDVARAYQMLEEDLRDIPADIAKRLVEGICWHDQYIVGATALSGDDRYGRFHDKRVHPFLSWGGGIYSIKTPEFEKVQVAAAMYGTWLANERVANGFWESMARGGEAMEDNAPTTVLDEWLIRIRKDPAAEGKLRPGNFWNGCIFAWNAFVEGKPIRSIKHDTSKGLYSITD